MCVCVQLCKDTDVNKPQQGQCAQVCEDSVPLGLGLGLGTQCNCEDSYHVCVYSYVRILT